MPTVNEFVADAIQRYPTLFGCRTDVLHHLFCVNGNGYEWRGGELVGYPERKRSLKALLKEVDNNDAKMAEMLARFDREDEAHEELRVLNETRQAKRRLRREHEKSIITFRYKNAADLALVTWSRDHDRLLDGPLTFRPGTIYPLCEYAKLARVPDDVKPDWLAAVREMIFEVFASSPRRPDGQFSEEHCAAEHQRNIEFASKSLESIASRFPPPPGQVTNYAEWVALRKRTNVRIAEVFGRLAREI